MRNMHYTVVALEKFINKLLCYVYILDNFSFSSMCTSKNSKDCDAGTEDNDNLKHCVVASIIGKNCSDEVGNGSLLHRLFDKMGGKMSGGR